MRKLLVHDTVNDIAVIQTAFGYHCRYGLEVSTCYTTLQRAVQEYQDCLGHALACEGLTDA